MARLSLFFWHYPVVDNGCLVVLIIQLVSENASRHIAASIDKSGEFNDLLPSITLIANDVPLQTDELIPFGCTHHQIRKISF